MEEKIIENKKLNLKLGVIASYLWVAIHIITNFIYTPLLIGFMKKSEYGLYQVVASFLAYINVIEASLSAGVLRFYCQANSQENKEQTQNVLSICKTVYNKFTVFTLLIGIVLIFAFRMFYQTSFNDTELCEGTAMLGLLIFNICISLKNALYLACIRGNERFVFEKVLSAIAQIVQPTICLLVLYKLPYALTVTAIQVFINIVVSTIRYLYAEKKLGIEIIPHKKNQHLEKSIVLFSAGLFLSNIADQIFWKTDQIILAKMYNTATAALYSIGAQIYTNYMYVGTTITSVFFPKVSFYYHQENGLEKISNLFIRVGRIAFFLCYMVLSGFLIFGREFLHLWLGDDYLSAYEIALLVMVPFTLDIIQNLGLTILQVIDKYSFRAKIYFVAALLNIVSTTILAKYFAEFGAALSTGITIIIVSGILLNIYYAHVIHINICCFWKNIGNIFIRLLPWTSICFILNNLIGLNWSFTSFIVKVIFYVLGYIIVCYYKVMNWDEKKIIDKIAIKIGTIRR